MHQITVIGLGAGDFDQLPMGVYKTLKNAPKLYVRTKEHPVLEELKSEGVDFESFDLIYEKHGEFLPVYQEIVETLKQYAEHDDVIYAVPGHPLVAEMTVELLIEEEKKGNVQLKIEGGQSFLDAVFATLKIDPIDGFQLVDGATFSIHHVNMYNHLLIAQVYDQFSASEVKLTLMEKYDAEYPVTIVTAAGSKDEVVVTVPLYELDHVAEISNLTTVYVPPATKREQAMREWSTFRDIMATMRGPEGCEWDKAQTHESMKRYMLEEMHEALQAIDEQDDEHMIEEFGDLLMLVFMQAQIGEDNGFFNLEDLLAGAAAKMMRRHPHVFGDTVVHSVEDINANWEKIKKAEHEAENKPDAPIMDGEYRAMSSLQTAYNYQRRAAKLGFEWPEAEQYWWNFEEEFSDFKNAALTNADNKFDQYSNALIALVNLGRHYKVSAEEAMLHANAKYAKRFGKMEAEVKASGRDWNDFAVEQLLDIWAKVKE